METRYMTSLPKPNLRLRDFKVHSILCPAVPNCMIKLITYNVRQMKLDKQFLAQNSENMMRAGNYYSLFITAENY